MVMRKILAIAMMAMMIISCGNVSEQQESLRQEKARLDSIAEDLRQKEIKMQQEALRQEKVRLDSIAENLRQKEIKMHAHEAKLANARYNNAEATPSFNAYRDDNPYEWLSQRKYSWREFASRASSPAECRIWRNAMFARHGYIFQSADLRKHFSQFTWYVPRYKSVTLTAIEVHNVNTLKSMEMP